ncbi:CRAL-TRIO domain-containing protein, partial [Gorgonomyces haynaldii]
MSGRVGSLSNEQQEQLQQFKIKLGDRLKPEHDDHLLLRFLRARNFDLELTYKMFTEFLDWREQNGVDTIIDDLEFPELPVVRQYYQRMYFNADKFGRPVYIERLGLLDVSKLLQTVSTERLIKYHIYEYEKLIHYRLKACSVKWNTHIEQSTTIIDLKGVYLSTFPSVFSIVREVSSIAQNYYPEMLGKMFIVNSPMLFSAVWNLIKPLLNEVTVNKISILGSSYKSELLQFIDEDKLPDFLGGTATSQNWESVELGPWNDHSVQGFPQPRFERVIL